MLDHFPTLPEKWTTYKVVSKFVWSPLRGCEGLMVENPVAISKPFGGQDGSSNQEMEEEIEDEMEESDDR